MRIGGVSVGKVKSIELAPPDERVNGKDTTEAVIEIEPQFAPISTDARAILRQKTLLGETVRRAHLRRPAGQATRPRSRSGPRATSPTPSRRRCSRSPRAARWGSAGPRTRPRSTRSSTRSTSRPATPSSAGRRTRRSAINGRGIDLNDAFGNLGPVPHRRLGHPRRPAPPEDRAEGPGARHRHGLPRADRAATSELAGAITGSDAHLRRARLARTRRWRRRSRSCPSSSASRALTLRAARPVPGQHPARWSRT